MEFLPHPLSLPHTFNYAPVHLNLLNFTLLS